MIKQDIKELTRDELKTLFRKNGFKECHSRTVFKMLYREGATDFDGIMELPKTQRQFLRDRFTISGLLENNRWLSEDGTEKFLFTLPEGRTVECVYIPEQRRGTLCVSSQLGCKFACSFCVSGKNGFIRNLTTAEMVNQVILVNTLMARRAISNVVFMGSGEPLDNYDNLMKAITILRDHQGLYIADRKISLSTCGLVPGIQRLINDKRGVRLSISLHSTDPKKRSAIMPVNKIYPLEQLKESVRQFTEAEGFPVFFEYIMIKGMNIAREDALSLAHFVKDINCKINLIPYNPSPHYDGQPPDRDEIDRFRKILEDEGVFYWIRKSRGSDIAAACGQLPSPGGVYQ